MSLSAITRCLLRWMLTPLFSRYVLMPGKSFNGDLPPPTAFELELASNTRRHIEALAVEIGERSICVPGALERAAEYIIEELSKLGLEVRTDHFTFRDIPMRNFYVDLSGRQNPDEILVVGAHYDTVCDSPGADDNATGVAAALELARILKSEKLGRTVRIAFFANEEDNGGSWLHMGSYQHAARCFERREKIVGMLSLEMLGYFSDEPGTQLYPFPFNLFYPDKGNFIGFVANTASQDFVREVVRIFRDAVPLPSEGVAAPERYADISRSDHWSFWQFGWPALMVTDTSNFRFPHLHEQSDTPDVLDFEKMARVVAGILEVIGKLADKR